MVDPYLVGELQILSYGRLDVGSAAEGVDKCPTSAADPWRKSREGRRWTSHPRI